MMPQVILAIGPPRYSIREALSGLMRWILIQGDRIVTGQSREPLMGLVTNALKAVLIIGIATGAAAGAGSIYGTLSNGLPDRASR